MSTLRFDGLYACRGTPADSKDATESTRYLRFYADGKVAGATVVGGTETAGQVAAWLVPGGKNAETGVWRLTGASLELTLSWTQPSGTKKVDYKGQVKDDLLDLSAASQELKKAARYGYKFLPLPSR